MAGSALAAPHFAPGDPAGVWLTKSKLRNCAVLEAPGLLLGIGPAEEAVSVGEAAPGPDHIAVLLGKLRKGRMLAAGRSAVIGSGDASLADAKPE